MNKQLKQNKVNMITNKFTSLIDSQNNNNNTNQTFAERLNEYKNKLNFVL